MVVYASECNSIGSYFAHGESSMKDFKEGMRWRVTKKEKELWK